jgi:Zn-dependent metalloprotease
MYRTRLGTKLLLVGWLLGALAAAGCSSGDNSPPPFPIQRLANDTGVQWDVDVDPATGTPSMVAAQSQPPPTAVNGVSPTEAAYRFFETYRDLFKMKDPRAELTVLDAPADADGAQHVLFQQVSAGVPVEAGYNVHFTPNGSIGFLNGRYVSGLANGAHTAGIDANAATSAARDALHKIDPAAPSDAGKAELVFLANETAVGRLAWRIVVGSHMFYVDAAKGTVLLDFDLNMHVSATADGSRGKRTFEVSVVTPTSWEMKWPAADGRTPLETRVKGKSKPIQSTALDTWDPIPAGGGGAGLAVDGHTTLMDVANWYRTEVGWKSYDDNDSTIIAYVHDNTLGEANAFWSGGTKDMHLGDGDIHHGGIEYPQGYLDVLGHELTHGVTQHTSQLRSNKGESGALNESLSDIFATFMQSKLEPGVANLKAFDELGRTTGVPLRDFMHPAKGMHADADCYTKLQSESHADAGISNNAFALMTFGGDKNDSSLVEVKGGIGMAASQKLWWYTQRYGIFHQPDTKFADVARAQMANIRFYSWFPSFLNRWLGGVGDVPIQPVACAWVATGVITQKEVTEQYGVRCYCEAKGAPASVCDGKSVMKDDDKQCCKPGDDTLCCKQCNDAGAGDGGGAPSKIDLTDSCTGRADGIYCSIRSPWSAIVCKGESTALGIQCANHAACIGPNGPGDDVQCEGQEAGAPPDKDAGPVGDTCAGRPDGVYCSINSPGSAYACVGQSTAGGQQCGGDKKCIGPNGPGADIICQ